MNGGPQSLERGIPFCVRRGCPQLHEGTPSFLRSCKTTLALELRCWLFPRVLLKPFLQTEQGKVVEDAARRTGIRENLPFSGRARVRKPSPQCGPLYRPALVSIISAIRSFHVYTGVGFTTSFCRD